MTEARYTLAMPADLYNELRRIAERESVTIKDVVRQCLKVGLIAAQIDEDPSRELIMREHFEDSGRVEDTRIKFLW